MYGDIKKEANDFKEKLISDLGEDLANAVISDMKKLGDKYICKYRGPVNFYSIEDIGGYTKCAFDVYNGDRLCVVYYKDPMHCRVIYEGKVTQALLNNLSYVVNTLGAE